MSLDTIPTRANAQTIDQTWFNVLKQVLSGDFVPRNISGTPADNSGNLGTAALRWLRAHITVGYWEPGDTKMHHSFNGTVSAGQGWMLMDGRQITQANYDAEHGAGSWAAHIGSSPLLNKYLPNAVNRYQVGGATTSQDGSTAITATGNANHAIPPHTHVAPAHNHQWYKWNGSPATADQSYNSSGNLFNFDVNAYNNKIGVLSHFTGYSGTKYVVDTDKYTSNAGASNTSNPSAASIQPDSIVFQPYMRII